MAVGDHIPEINIGIDWGQRVDHSAFIVAEIGKRPIPPRPHDPPDLPPSARNRETVWNVRRIIEMPTGLLYRDQAEHFEERIRNLVDLLHKRLTEGAKTDWHLVDDIHDSQRLLNMAASRVHCFLDVTGPGRGPCEDLRDRLRDLPGISFTFVRFVSGDKDTIRPGVREAAYGKEEMVSQMAVKLEQERIGLPEDSEFTPKLMQQLADYQRSIKADTGHAQYGGKKLHDDLVVACSLATAWDPMPFEVTTITADWLQ